MNNLQIAQEKSNEPILRHGLYALLFFVSFILCFIAWSNHAYIQVCLLDGHEKAVELIALKAFYVAVSWFAVAVLVVLLIFTIFTSQLQESFQKQACVLLDFRALVIMFVFGGQSGVMYADWYEASTRSFVELYANQLLPLALPMFCMITISCYALRRRTM